ncbi:MAG: hypothetical protein ACKOC5_00075 [Chloroflexota bacterium]
MVLKSKINRGLLALVLLALAVSSGCAAQQPQVVYPTVVIVQYVTQVVATVTASPVLPTSTPTPAATSTPSPFRLANGFDPFSVQITYPLTNCPVGSRLAVGEQAFVASGAGTIGLSMSTDIGPAPLYRKLDAGEILYIVGGPFCKDNGLVWQVIASDGKWGYVPEGNGSIYWLLPFGEVNPTGLPKKSPTPSG